MERVTLSLSLSLSNLVTGGTRTAAQIKRQSSKRAEKPAFMSRRHVQKLSKLKKEPGKNPVWRGRAGGAAIGPD